ncbi:MAG: hypothetical protein Q9213_003635 [Squamulea squamosa]
MEEAGGSDGQFASQKQTIDKIAGGYSNTESQSIRGYQSILGRFSIQNYSQHIRIAYELIQNADDAKYTRISHPNVPRLVFEAHADSLYVRCNEDGFTARDVEALCSVKQSAKYKANSIGKKGIGFKSVFRFCDRVLIGSNGFQFGFDKRDGPIGMTKPTWQVFPEWLDDQESTYICLWPCRGRDPRTILGDVEDLEPSVLLFLRNIQEISVHDQDTGYRQVMTCHDRGQQEVTVTTQSWSGDQELSLQSAEYTMVNHKPDPSGPELILAFPRFVDGLLEAQQVHNFLPIRSYGFKFIIQAEFYVISNREAINEDIVWNHTLRDLFLPGPSTLQDFFAMTDINRFLVDKEVLFSHTEKLMKPSDLIQMPPEFRFEKDRPVPLILNHRHALSTCYDGCDINVLKMLGVEQLNERFFVDALKVLGNEGWPDIAWHEDLAKILLDLNTDHLADIPLIPVAGNQGKIWVNSRTSKSSPIYFEEDLGNHKVPRGVKIRYVPAESSRYKYRRLLFEKLHVQPLSITTVCEAIAEDLQSNHSPPSIEDTITQTKYLFQHRKEFPNPNIAFWANVDGRARAASIFQQEMYWMDACTLYFEDPRQSPHPISRLLYSHERFHSLHSDYLQEDKSIHMADWMDWLIERGMSVSPRPVLASDHSRASPDFIHFAEHAEDESLSESVTMEHVMADLKSLAKAGDFDFIKNNVKPILVRLSMLLKRAEEDCLGHPSGAHTWKAELEKLKIWPMTTNNGKTSKLIRSRKFSSDDFLFVPDRPDLYDLFRNEVPLLDFTPYELSDIKTLMDCYPKAHFLSWAVRSKITCTGTKTLHQSMTSEFRGKHEAILRCVRHYLPSLGASVNGMLHDKLKAMNVYEVKTVSRIQWVQRSPLKTYYKDMSLDDVMCSGNKNAVAVKTRGEVIVQQDWERFEIYMTKDEASQTKAKCYSIPKKLSAELGLPAEAQGVIAIILGLEISASSTILDEMGIARLPGVLLLIFFISDTMQATNSHQQSLPT